MKDDWGQLSCSTIPLQPVPVKLSSLTEKLMCLRTHSSFSSCLTCLFQFIDSADEALHTFGWHISSVISRQYHTPFEIQNEERGRCHSHPPLVPGQTALFFYKRSIIVLHKAPVHQWGFLCTIKVDLGVPNVTVDCCTNVYTVKGNS